LLVKYMKASQEAQTVMPFTHGMTREEVRLVDCPKCGAWSAYLCFHRYRENQGRLKPGHRIHRARVLRAVEYRLQHRI
jgi:hypothetical protein